MSPDERDPSLVAALGADDDPAALPPLGALLEAELAALTPVRTRRPLRDLALVLVMAAVSIVGFVVLLTVRRDLEALPRGWLVAYGGAWLAGLGALAWLTLVPRPGTVLPRWQPAALLAALAAIGFIAAGFALARTTPLSLVYAPTLANHGRYAAICLAAGLAAAALPFAAGAWLLRGAVPVGARATGAALGAATACAGGLMLHVHCPITHEVHVGLGHGAVVLAGALLGALALPIMARR